MKHLIMLFLSLLLIIPEGVMSQGRVFKYRVYLKDKKESAYSKRNPSQFLSQKALQRRAKFGIKIDNYDLPVSETYINEISSRGVNVLCVSKWNNTLLVEADDSLTLSEIAKLPFVDSVKKVYDGVKFAVYEDSTRFSEVDDALQVVSDYYGMMQHQIEQLNGIALHNLGFRGQDMTVAVIDGGFRNADVVKNLDNVEILGTHNFVIPGHTVYDGHYHGTSVLSCMAANKPSIIVGTAPEAKYWLLVSEDGRSESPSEQDTWAAALEFADSVGVDVVNTSLGYEKYDDITQNVKYRELDGKTHLISRSASMAAAKGIMVVNSAGNSGIESWKLITVPADADNVITVGAIDKDGVNAMFSSLGNTADGRIKPDVMALGVNVPVVQASGKVDFSNGTSFSSPITAGMVTCLMQALPSLKPTEIISLIHESSDRFKHPDNVFGYGVPDYYKAYKKGKP